MKSNQFAERIGNIDDKLIEQAESAPGIKHIQYNRNIRKAISVAVVVALMASSFMIGAFASTAEPEIIHVEKEQEIIEVGDSGISLILPDSWKGKYEYSYEPNLRFNAFVEVYHPATNALLFWIERVEGQYTMDIPFPERGFTIAITDDYTYVFGKVWWNVMDDIDDPIAWAEYEEMRTEIGTIEIVLTADMLANSINAANWIAGTVTVSLSENGEKIKDIVCDNEQSKAIRAIIEQRNYIDEGPPVYPPDEDWTEEYIEQRQQETDALNAGLTIWVMVNGVDYFLNANTGGIWILKHIPNSNYRIYGEHLSEEELNTIMGLPGI